MYKKIFLLAFLFYISCLHLLFAQGVKFDHPFAPDEGFVKSVEKPFRDEICLNGSWQFLPVKLGESLSFEEIKSPELPDEAGWEKTPIKIPSPWNVNGFTNGEGGDFRTFPSYPEKWNSVKSAWMKKTIQVPRDWSGNRFILYFEAIAGYTKIFVNGHEVGEHFDTFLPFHIDVSDYVNAGEEMEILVWVAHGSLLNDPGKFGRRNYVGGSFWGMYIAGIWQNVYLQKLPEVYISDTYIKPWVERDELEIDVTVKNTTSGIIKFSFDGDINRWVNLNGKSIMNIPELNWTLGENALKISASKLQIDPGETKVFPFKAKINGTLDLWSPDSPNLYALVLSLNKGKATLDRDYTRFGWRQFDIQGNKLLLNGKAIQIKGDSWHFMGVPQMTRRYAFAWYQMLLDANANGLRLHAQVFPRFYLEMADEMGICVLDETAIWSSDGGPKIDSEIYWDACRKHVKGLVLRDRNYPSVMGWSVCNETLPVTKHVFQAPQELIDRNIDEINNWVAIVRETDPTRTWISGDGETQAETDLPTVIGHYGGEAELIHWSEQGKPWGIGETGMAYYGTPAQVSKINGDRAYESQLGRMEGLAGEAFDLITMQRDHDASYTSIFNLAWYGLKPLALGLTDISRAPELKDGIYFSEYVEGKPGYQPERLGPYSSTFNPAYDPTLPLYKPWPLFYAVKTAFSDNYRELDNPWKHLKDNTVQIDPEPAKQSLAYLPEINTELKKQFENLAISFEPFSVNQKQLIIVDGTNPPEIQSKLASEIKVAVQHGSTLLIWGASETAAPFIEKLTGSSVQFYRRNATSYIIKGRHPILRNLNNASLYFSEMTRNPVSDFSMGGNWIEEAQVILEACNTDWQKWNYQGEAIKTAKVYRNEREFKPEGNVVVRHAYGSGEIIVSAVNFFTLGKQSQYLVKNMIENLGGSFNGPSQNIPEALNDEGILSHVNFYGSVKNDSREIKLVFTYTPMSDVAFTEVKIGTLTNGQYWDTLSSDPDGNFNFKKLNLKQKNYASAYLSFWMYSPRSLSNLLIEPDMPRLDMHFFSDDAFAFCVNGRLVKEYFKGIDDLTDEITFTGIPLEKGWNHILIKVGQDTGDWNCKVRFTSNNPDFWKEIKTLIDK